MKVCRRTTVDNVRNSMYSPAEAHSPYGEVQKPAFSAEEPAIMTTTSRSSISRPIYPVWVKVSVAIALGLGTMVGWKRIVVTVGEKSGKAPDLRPGCFCRTGRYVTIVAADIYGIPVYHAHTVIGRRGHDGGEQERAPVVDHPEYRGGMGLHLTGGGSYVCRPVLGLCAICAQGLNRLRDKAV